MSIRNALLIIVSLAISSTAIRLNATARISTSQQSNPPGQSSSPAPDVFNSNSQDRSRVTLQGSVQENVGTPDPLHCFYDAWAAVRNSNGAYQLALGGRLNSSFACHASAKTPDLEPCWAPLQQAKSLMEQAADLYERALRGPDPKGEINHQANSVNLQSRPYLDQAYNCYAPIYKKWFEDTYSTNGAGRRPALPPNALCPPSSPGDVPHPCTDQPWNLPPNVPSNVPGPRPSPYSPVAQPSTPPTFIQGGETCGGDTQGNFIDPGTPFDQFSPEGHSHAYAVHVSFLNKPAIFSDLHSLAVPEAHLAIAQLPQLSQPPQRQPKPVAAPYILGESGTFQAYKGVLQGGDEPNRRTVTIRQCLSFNRVQSKTPKVSPGTYEITIDQYDDVTKLTTRVAVFTIVWKGSVFLDIGGGWKETAQQYAAYGAKDADTILVLHPRADPVGTYEIRSYVTVPPSVPGQQEFHKPVGIENWTRTTGQ